MPRFKFLVKEDESMPKKKLAIYGLALALFALLFSAYLWVSYQTSAAANEQYIQESLDIFETQVKNNLDYEAKNLLFEWERGNHPEADPAAAASSLAEISAAHGRPIYIVDAEGTAQHPGAAYHGRRFEPSVLKNAQSTGYAAAPLAGGESSAAPDVALLVPLADAAPYCVMAVYTSHEFAALLSRDLDVDGSLFLFDEWGNVTYSPTAIGMTLEDKNRMLDNASLYTHNRLDSIHRACVAKTYNVYFSVTQPQSWFAGLQVNLENRHSSTSALFSSTLIVFVLLVLVLFIVVLLDVLNDRERLRSHSLSANVDPLTGLVTSAGMQGAVTAFLDAHTNGGYSFICMDIASFSRINTMFGYEMGDSLLRAVAGTIQEQYECGAHVNADYFTFFAANRDDLTDSIAENLHSGIEFQLGKELLQLITFKFGVYPLPAGHITFRELYEGTLQALKDAKRHALQNGVVYDQNLKKTFEMQKNIEMNMMHALSKEEFLVYVQPQFSMPDEDCTRGETLIRWRSDFMGFLPPDKFVPIFESNGFIVETDLFMLTSALALLKSRIDSGLSPVTLAVNQSKVTMCFPNYYERLSALIAQYDVPLQYIELEVTESTLENNWEVIVPLIHSMKRLGFSIAMDDFGSGFSSLNTLRILPIDVLKIDKEFLQESDGSERSKTIIRSIINLAKGLNIKVVCEGVETQEQLAFLKAAGCDIIQGFLFSKPIPMDDFITKYLT